MEHAQNLLRSERAKLDHLDQLIQALWPSSADLQGQRSAVEQNMRRLEEKMVLLAAALVAAKRLGVPAFVTIHDFTHGLLLPRTILAFMAMMPANSSFTPRDLVDRMAEEEPRYVRRIKKAELDDADASNTSLARRLGPRFDSVVSRPDSPYVRISGTGRRRYKRSAYLSD